MSAESKRITMRTDYTTWNDDKLKVKLETVGEASKALEKKLRQSRNLERKLKDETNRRFLEAYWTHNPDAVKVAQYDKIVVTKDGQQAFKGLKPSIGAVLKVWCFEDGGFVCGDFHWNISIEATVLMRRAYLESEAA